jgi:translation elongation factor EF-1beta
MLKRYKSIQNRIYEVRGNRIMLDYDLATLYEVETRVLNQAVKRNAKRFPKDFMFQLKALEYEIIRSQTDSTVKDMSSQFVMTYPIKRPLSSLPYAFTEQGVAMLSGVLNSDKAIDMNIAIMRAFVEIRKITLSRKDIKKQLQEIKKRIKNHDVNIEQLYEAIENLLDEKAAQRKWDERNRIGYKATN